MFLQLGRQMRSERNGNGDRTRAHSDRKSKGIESIFEDLVIWGRLSFRSSGVLAEQRPSGSGHNQASPDLYCINGDTEECEHMHSPQQGAEQQEETIDGDLLRKQALGGRRDGTN